MKFEYCSNNYTYEFYRKNILNELEYPIFATMNPQSDFINVGCGFDIETTRHSETISYMYTWAFALNDTTIIGRTWEEFIEFMHEIRDYFELDEHRKLLCYCHNLSFEWQFIRKIVTPIWNSRRKKPEVFATEERQVVRFLTTDFIEFRDSQILTGCKLADIPRMYNLNINKLVGDLDYSLSRNSQTTLTDSELAYIINDVQILNKFYWGYIKPFYLNKKIKIPLTQTGIPRNELKRHFKKQPKEVREKHKRMVQRAFPTEKEYKNIYRWLFRGGFVHATASIVGETWLFDDWSQDFKSSYPSVMLQEEFVNRFCLKPPSYFDDIKQNIKKWSVKHGFYGTFRFKNIRAKYPHSIESVSKLVSYDKDSLLADNGRMVYCKEIVVCLTEQDYMNYDEFYTFDKVTCEGRLRVGDKQPLPTWFKDLVLKYFTIKETMPKDSLEYKIAKSKLNSLYGMCVTNIMHNELIFDNGKLRISGATDFNKSKQSEILLPQWGVWITAYARRRLLHHGILPFCKIGAYNEVYYSDTDSLKYRNDYAYRWIFDSYNTIIHRKNLTMYVGEFDRKLFMQIGKFDCEGKSYRFKTLGAKRYIHDDIVFNKTTGKFELSTITTIAGLPKGNLQQYCSDNDVNIYDVFNDGMEIVEQCTKLSHHYNDNVEIITSIDYQGHVETIEIPSSTTLNPTSFNLGMKKDYLQMIVYMTNQYRKRGMKA